MVPVLAELPEITSENLKKVVITGARAWENNLPIQRVVNTLSRNIGSSRLLIITSNMPGVEVKAGNYAEGVGIHVARINGLHKQFGQEAAAIRGALLNALEPDLVIGMHWNIHDSKYTKAILLGAKRRGIRYRIVKVSMQEALPSAEAYQKMKDQKRQVAGLDKRDRQKRRRKKK